MQKVYGENSLIAQWVLRSNRRMTNGIASLPAIPLRIRSKRCYPAVPRASLAQRTGLRRIAAKKNGTRIAFMLFGRHQSCRAKAAVPKHGVGNGRSLLAAFAEACYCVISLLSRA